ncbi:hypothetical protein SEA_SALVADOR_58 [Gordonia phage Salvador]|uniref:Uncharacterized protein n=2 Tax=Wizardvirus TaxID=2169658 RepID=A0A6M3SZU9_9CAUD|nr:hypothetical protein KNU68_gp59 [Gordonia phage Nubi]YP_010107694.1 hypothetical protein KNV01_gp58 [Gordonia phage Evamon]QDH85192.1 hypothetical protein SEA_NUBI_59 [Gordonia phage Nubi]QJD51553.1 hypothetical protein SEA_EVAMON_58 [Gordonia phage Evamon]UVK62380.1 hypothetical protein SEA_SALVADOR_58 [Gordonia phage Salvador]
MTVQQLTLEVAGGVVGYYILNRDDPESLWDGTLHPTIESAREQLDDALSNPSEYGTGWFIAECRKVAP